MKKIVIFIILFTLPSILYAQTINIKDVKLSIDDNWKVFTRDNLNNNKNLEIIKVDENYMNNYFIKNNIYMDAVSDDLNKDLLVIIEPTDKNINYEKLTKKELNDVMNDVSELITYDIYSNKFLRYMFKDESTNYYFYTYQVSMNNNVYYFQLQKASEFTKDEISQMDEIIDNLEFTSKNNTWMYVLAGLIVLLLVVYILKGIVIKK